MYQRPSSLNPIICFGGMTRIAREVAYTKANLFSKQKHHSFSSPPFTFFFPSFFLFLCICAGGWTQRLLLHVRQALHLWARNPNQSLVSTDLDRIKLTWIKSLHFKDSFAVFLMYNLDFTYGNVEYVYFCTLLQEFSLNLKHFL